MSQQILIRRHRPEDSAQVEALWDGVGPYRPGDEALIEEMYERARRARLDDDLWWMDHVVPAEDTIEEPSAGWVAVVPSETGPDRVVGIVDVEGAPVLQMPSDMPLAQEWGRRTDIATLTRLSVAPEFWRRGLGSSLIQAAAEWCRERLYKTLVLNTTSPQVPAMSLYRKVGFREAGRSYLGRYELVWFELAL